MSNYCKAKSDYFLTKLVEQHVLELRQSELLCTLVSIKCDLGEFEPQIVIYLVRNLRVVVLGVTATYHAVHGPTMSQRLLTIPRSLSL